MTLHEFLDCGYGSDGEAELRRLLSDGADVNGRSETGEAPLHVATRRRRCGAVSILLDHGAEIDATTAGGKTAHAHAARRGFDDVAMLLAERGADTTLNDADRFALAIGDGRLDEARRMLAGQPSLARTGNPEEDRLLADMAGRDGTGAVELLIEAGADLAATGLDGGTALHQAAWFGRPANARILIDAGASLDVFDSVHESSPLGWAVHGARNSGGADERQDAYVEIVRMLLDAGSSLHYPGRPGDDAYLRRLHADATPRVREVLPEIG